MSLSSKCCRVELLILPSGGVADSRYQFLATYVINGQIALDAGALGCGLALAAQKQITNIFLSHCHLDHIATLPIFLENVYQPGPGCVRVHGLESTLQTIRKDVLNDRIWPDFIALSAVYSPFLELNCIQPEQVLEQDGIKIIPLALDHIVPTLGFIVSSATATVALISDTAPSETILAALLRLPRLDAVFLECSFPRHLNWLAEKTKHFSPISFEVFARALPETVRIIAVHIKSAWYDMTVQELNALQCPNIEIGQIGQPYQF